MEHKDFDLKIQNCQHAYQSYQHLLNQIKEAMRLGMFDRMHLKSTMNNINNYVIDNSPIVDKFYKNIAKSFLLKL